MVGYDIGMPDHYGQKDDRRAHPTAWFWVLGLIGLDYFSTLGYWPTMACDAAGTLAPLATIVLVLVTLLAALPVYAFVAGRSPHGQGSSAVLETLIPGWKGKFVVVVLLGFAATDFVFTKTVAAADAAVHLIHHPNPVWQSELDLITDVGAVTDATPRDSLGHVMVRLWDRQMVVALLLLLVGFGFWYVFRLGFTRRVVQMACVVVGTYLLLNAIVIGSGLYYLAGRPDLVADWWRNLGNQGLAAGDSQSHAMAWAGMLSILLLPKMILGLSGFEMSLVAMPLVRGDKTDTAREPWGRIRQVRKMLLTAALIMSAFLLGSALLTTLLIPAEAIATPGQAQYRTLAYVAHGGLLTTGADATDLCPLFGHVFGTVYDLSTIVILCLAGASTTLALRNIVPRNLQRLGMQFQGRRAAELVFHLFNAISLIVTVVFRASVTAQRGAYATGFLVIVAGGAYASYRACKAHWHDKQPPHARQRIEPGFAQPLVWRAGTVFFALALCLFSMVAVAVVANQPTGVLLATWFILALLTTSVVTRFFRNMELRCEGLTFKDEGSRFLWDSLRLMDFPALIPVRPGRETLAQKEAFIRDRHRLPQRIPVVFLMAEVGDASDFLQTPELEIAQQEGRFVIHVRHCASIAHVLAYVGIELSRLSQPPEFHFGWSEESPLATNLHFVLFGEGNVPWMVRELIRRSDLPVDKQPRIVVG